MHLLVGLGNPGPKYDRTPHNIGFALVDSLFEAHGATPVADTGPWKTEGKSLTRKLSIAGETVLVVKPQTFMNLSGEAAQSLLAFYKIHPKNLVIVSDDVYLDRGSLRIRMQGGHGGHNGLRNIIEHCGDAFVRIRIGVGPCPDPDKAAFVLRKYGSEEEKSFAPIFKAFPKLVETGITKGWERAATDFNIRVKNAEG
jgi:PTH1 family peptidyl-tRNA hydrolase